MTRLHLHLTRVLLITIVLTHLISAETFPFSRRGLGVRSSNPFGSDDSSGQSDTVVFGMRCEDNCRVKFLLTPGTLLGRSQLEGPRMQGPSVDKDRPRAICPRYAAISELHCDFDCRAMKILCRRLTRGLKIDTNRRKKVWARKNGIARFSVAGVGSGSAGVLPGQRRSEQRLVRQFDDETWECDDTYYLWGVECFDVNCEEIYLICALVLIEEEPRTPPTQEPVLCRILANPGDYTATSDRFGPNEISEVVPGPVCGVNCIGTNCAKKELVYVGGVDMLGGVDYYTGWLTSGTTRRCPDGMVVSQVECSGLYCKWIRLGCQRVGKNIVMGNKRWRGPGGRGTIWCNDHEYLTGMYCMGRYCRQIELRCTELECA